MLLTNDEEIEAAKRLGGKGRAIGSFPIGTRPIDAQIFLNTGWDGLSYKVRVDCAGILSKIELPKFPKLKVG